MGNSEIFFHGNTSASNSKKNYLSILIMESFHLQSYHQNEFKQKVEEDNLKMLASIASFCPQLSINSGGYANYFTEKKIQNEMGFQQQNYIDPAMFYYHYYHNSEHCYHYYLEKNIFPQIQEFLGSQQYIGGEDSKQSYYEDDTSLCCPDLKNNVKQEIIAMEEVQEDSGNDDATNLPQIQKVFGGEEAQLLIEGTEELLCKHCYYPGHETFQCPSLYKLALKEIENYESYNNSTNEESSKMALETGGDTILENEIPSDIKCPHMPLKKRGKLSCVSCFLLTV